MNRSRGTSAMASTPNRRPGTSCGAVPAIPSDALFANAVGGIGCFALSQRQVRSALLLLHFGIYESVAPLLRLAFEAAECGQYLAMNPSAAAKWLSSPTRWPSKPVRSRLGDLTRHEDYGRHYGTLSSVSHPTARSVMMSVELREDSLRPRRPWTKPDSRRVFELAVLIASTAGFTCYAFVNANPEGATQPAWRRQLKAIMEHLDRITYDLKWKIEKRSTSNTTKV